MADTGDIDRILLQVTQPSAGAEWSYAVPSGQAWTLIGVYFELVTYFTGSSREVNLVFTDGASHTIGKFRPPEVQASNLTNSYSWYCGMGYEHSGAAMVSGLPPEMALNSGYTIGTSTANRHANDQFRYIVILYNRRYVG